MASLDFKAFDADNHYYEAEDAFIRHVDPKMHKRCMQWAELSRRSTSGFTKTGDSPTRTASSLRAV